ncbi:MAG: dihydroneopterin aldolase [Verrucomicrobia bacterium]|nr:dihydroneopterin aldolase [Verrucomicrobiota bacterium]
MIRNVILDWSGTLVNDLAAVVRATNAVLAKYGAPAVSEERFRREFVLPLPKYYQQVLPGVPLSGIDQVYHECFSRFHDSVALLQEAETFLRFCRATGRRMFLLSTVRRRHFEALAERFGIRRFFEAVYVDVADKTLQTVAVLRDHRLAPQETVLIGDMAHDIEAAQAAGVISVAVLTGFDPVEKLTAAGPDLLVRDLGRLQTIWEPGPSAEEWVEIVDLEVSTRIGVPEAERAAPQKLWLDLAFQLERPFAGLQDRVQRTVDYAAVAGAVREFAREHECHLIETFASRVGDLLRRSFPVRNVRVVLRKVVLPGTRCVQVRTSLTGLPVA